MFKKKIGITQKIFNHPDYEETMNCLDINWTKFLISLNILPVPLPILPTKNTINLFKELNLNGLILSGGNTLEKYKNYESQESFSTVERDEFEMSLLNIAVNFNIPVLGICRGLQIINDYFGGKLIKTKGHSNTRHPIYCDPNQKTYSFPDEVNSYHNFGIGKKCLGKNLLGLAYDNLGNIEAAVHVEHDILGIMWHPERDEENHINDINLIKKHFKL